MPHIVEKGTRIRTRRERRSDFAWQIIKGVIRFCIVGVLIVAMWYVTRLPFFSLSDVAVSGGETISHEEIRTSVEQELEGTYFLIVPKRFSYTYPHDRIVTVLEKNQRIHNIVVERTSRTALGVSFDEYFPHALWCTEDTAKPCFFITREGYAFALSPTLQGGAFVRHFVEGLDEVREGEVIRANELARIDAFIQRLNDEQKLRVASLVYRQDGDITFNLHGGGMIFINRNKDFNATFENVAAVLNSDEFKHLKPGNFAYVDARFDNKVFVNEQMIQEEATTTATSTGLSE